MTTSKGAAIDIIAASKHYGGFRALDDVSLSIRPGEFMTFLGPSGSGKTTTLNLIAGFTDLSGGDIRLNGGSIGGLPSHKRNIGVVFQHYALFPHMSVAGNVEYPLKLRKMPRALRRERAARAMEMVQLTDFAHRYPAELSGGQQQRVALARAMVFDPPALLMDEPLGALDKKLRDWLQLEIKRIHRELGTTFVYVTHDQEEALVLSDRIAVFNHGRIEQIGTGQQLYTRPETLFVGRFIGESSVIGGAFETRGEETRFDVPGGQIILPGRPGGAGPQVVLMRPEHLRVAHPGSAPEPGTARLTGRVTEAIYLGAAVKYDVTLPDGTVLTSRMTVPDAPFAIGDEVAVEITQRSCVMLPDDQE